MDVFWVLFWNLTIIMSVFLGYQILSFREEVRLETKVEQLQEELIGLQDASDMRQNELEEYFIMWVHQMKTPITASQLILKNPDDEAIRNLRQEMVSIENYTNMALNYLKLSNPATDMVFSERKLDDIITPLIRKYSLQFIQHGIRLHYQPIEAEVVTEANLTSLMIEQILNNALKYAKQKEIWISYDSKNASLTIKDSGKGIKAEDLPKIFDKGYSGFNGQLNQKSSGIGLYLVELVARRLNQPVSVESTFGQETQFTIQFNQTS
jgi:two-component system sensor histidine kinase BraS/BceS